MKEKAGSYFLTRQIDRDGSCYLPPTLTRFLGECITRVESLFGERDKRFTPLGIEIVEGWIGKGDNQDLFPPCLWFPPSDTKNHIIILLHPNVICGEALAKWQVAHESVHLLDPGKHGKASVLEEGIAAWFQNDFAPLFGYVDTGSYGNAEGIVKKHKEKIFRAIKELRADGIRLSDINAPNLEKYGVTSDDAQILASTFSGRHEKD